MSAAIVAAAGISVLAVFFFLVESESLSDGHARVRTQVLNTARWALVIALAWVLIPGAFSESGPQRGTTILGMVALVGALMLVPVRWFVRIGGRKPTWELRRVKIETTQLANRVRRDPASVDPVKLTDAIDRIVALRTLETSEFCDLIAAELQDLLGGDEIAELGGLKRAERHDPVDRVRQLHRVHRCGVAPDPVCQLGGFDLDPPELPRRFATTDSNEPAHRNEHERSDERNHAEDSCPALGPRLRKGARDQDPSQGYHQSPASGIEDLSSDAGMAIAEAFALNKEEEDSQDADARCRDDCRAHAPTSLTGLLMICPDSRPNKRPDDEAGRFAARYSASPPTLGRDEHSFSG